VARSEWRVAKAIPAIAAGSLLWLASACSTAAPSGVPTQQLAYDSAQGADGSNSSGDTASASESPSSVDTGTPVPRQSDGTLVGTVLCADPAPAPLAASGLPLIQTNAGAPVVLFVDYDGGTHFSSSKGKTLYSGYNRNGSPSTFDAEEQADIIASMQHMAHYYAMFDVNVTSDESVRQAAQAWGWIIVTEDESGGSGSLSLKAIGQEPYARSYCGASTVRIEDGDKSRRVAHELGHNFMLEHSGVWEGSVFYKWEDWPPWDKVYGPIMGGGGYGKRNGWAKGNNEADPESQQDEMDMIRQRIVDVSDSATGWRADDFAAGQAAALCNGGAGKAFRRGVLGSPADTDEFALAWPGGTIAIDARAIDTSAALPVAEVLSGDSVVGSGGAAWELPAGNYILRIRSSGEYGAIGSYEVKVTRP
jgi:hypothetical protein